MIRYLKKIALLFSLTVLACTFACAPEAKAGSGKALAITGLVLGGTALGVVGYNAYQNRRQRNSYYDNRNAGYYQSSYRRPCQRNNYYGPRYRNSGYGGRYNDYYDYDNY